MNPEYATMKTDEIEDLIYALQGIQKRTPPTSKEWKDASAELAPLFAEMAQRTAR